LLLIRQNKDMIQWRLGWRKAETSSGKHFFSQEEVTRNHSSFSPFSYCIFIIRVNISWSVLVSFVFLNIREYIKLITEISYLFLYELQNFIFPLFFIDSAIQIVCNNKLFFATDNLSSDLGVLRFCSCYPLERPFFHSKVKKEFPHNFSYYFYILPFLAIIWSVLNLFWYNTWDKNPMLSLFSRLLKFVSLLHRKKVKSLLSASLSVLRSVLTMLWLWSQYK
jgi:hypothetical protein